MSLHPFEYRTPLDTLADHERAVHHHSDRDDVHHRVLWHRSNRHGPTA